MSDVVAFLLALVPAYAGTVVIVGFVMHEWDGVAFVLGAMTVVIAICAAWSVLIAQVMA